MSFPASVVNSRIEAFKQACVERGVKVTHQRLEIYRALASSVTHPDAETIYRIVRKRIPTISHDTVYRNLKLLSDYGLIAVAGTSNERLRFDANMERHHHFVCVQCGLIRDFCSEQLESIHCPQEAHAFGEPVSLHIEVKGVCTKCGSHKKKKK
ncbi:MAG: transcriptional repressor [Candidatus Hydrogenedentes bacterium]|nr:transcriptional repressor [Candidatus Hydrogenedentota bacterium]